MQVRSRQALARLRMKSSNMGSDTLYVESSHDIIPPIVSHLTCLSSTSVNNTKVAIETIDTNLLQIYWLPLPRLLTSVSTTHYNQPKRLLNPIPYLDPYFISSIQYSLLSQTHNVLSPQSFNKLHSLLPVAALSPKLRHSGRLCWLWIFEWSASAFGLKDQKRQNPQTQERIQTA